MKQHLTTPNQKQRLEGLLRETRKRLIETGTRNRLVHTNRKGKRPSSLQIVGADAEALFLSLARGGAKFRFSPDPHATERERRKEDEARGEADELPYVPGGKLTGDLLQTRLGETALQLRLTRLAREAKTIEEEQGANILYLAIGFLQWYEDEKSQVLREAPLLLLPISLERDARRSTYVLSPREEDISTNLPLAERLMDQDGIVLPEIPEGEEWTATDYFDAVAEAVASRKRWSIDRSGMELGFFSFAKLLMFRDLAAEAWREGAILDHPLLRGLMQEGFGHESALFPDDTRLDERLTVADLVQVVDADSSQTLAIETVRAGRNLVIHGPPGTGKSQTIANIIAAAAHDGKTVLFIAEKMVALEVVHRRLRDVGLGPICLELHSHRANKRAVVEELRATLEAGVAQPPSSLAMAELSTVRDRLNEIAGAMHKPVAVSGRTPFQVIGELARAKGTGIAPPATRFPGAENWTQHDFEAICEATRVFADIAHGCCGVQAHPWRGVGKLDLQPNERDRLNTRIAAFGACIERLRGFLGEGAAIMPAAGCDLQSAERLRVFLGHLAALPAGRSDSLDVVQRAQGVDTAEIMQRLTVARALMADIDKRAAAFQRPAFTAHTSSARQALVHGTASIFKRWGSAYMPLRKLIQRTGGTIQKLKPVFLMSPISVAQYLPPGSVEFDLLVIDEASQVRPEDALGVIARVKQMVVVGDAKQLPPTSFFSRVLADEPEGEEDDDEAESPQDALAGAAKIGEMESILTLCEARGVPSKLLRWHYRSKHPSLIEISNREFYKDLFLPPSPATTREEDGFVFVRVDGVYDRGGKRSNEIEAKAVVAALAAHAARNPDRSIGIVTFSTTQRDLVSNLIESARRSDEVLNAFLDSLAEEVFVKNLENVQGDERDHILVSVGYGPQTPGGRLVSANFGPVSKEGGERRLNVLFTRARYRCEVFCSFDPADIDTDRAKSLGAAVFKRYLAFAMTGIAEEPRPTGGDYDSPFEEDVAREIRAMGYLADPQVGTAGFKIDLGLRDAAKPGRYLLAIECDGATYHGALWARERDRLRQEILESQGWTFHRIWSTDWFYRRAAELARLKQAIETASANSGRKAPKVLPPAPVTPAVTLTPVNAPVAPPSVPTAPPYRIARALAPKGCEPHELSAAEMAPVVKQIIDGEGPIHSEEVARRVAEVFGKERTGARIQAVALEGLKHLVRTDTTYRSSDQFWFTVRQEAEPPVRSRTNAPLSLQKAAMLPPIEIKACILKAIDDNGGLSALDLSIAVARIFGFQRTGPDIKEAISRAVDRLVEAGVLQIEDGQVGRAK